MLSQETRETVNNLIGITLTLGCLGGVLILAWAFFSNVLSEMWKLG